jgi:SAM-dependent methyltransferase
MVCFLCKKNNFEIVYKLPSKKVIRCLNDGLFLVEETKRPVKKLYGKEYYENSPYSNFLNLNENYFLKKLYKIKELTKNTDPIILDVGCGWGDFLKLLKKQGINYLGIDQSDEAVVICRSNKLNAVNLTLQDLIRQKKQYSAITFFQVIEHLKNPLLILTAAKKLLKKNGIILLTTPNNDSPLRKIFGAKWSVYNENSHFVFYDKQTLRKILEVAGFKNIEIRIDSPRFLSIGYVFNRLNEMDQKSYSPKVLKSFFYDFPVPTDFFGDLEAVASV